MDVATNEVREPAWKRASVTQEVTAYWVMLLHKHGPAVRLKLSSEAAAGEQLTCDQEANLLAECLRSKGSSEAREALRQYLRVVHLDNDYDANTIEGLFRLVLTDGDSKLLGVLAYLLVLKATREGLTTTDVFVERIIAEAA